MTTLWSATLVQFMAAVSLASFVAKTAARGFEEASIAALPCASLLSLAQMTVPSLELPLGEFVPWWSVMVLAVTASVGPADMRKAAGLQIGRLDGGPLLWSVICVVISTPALVGWSRVWVRGDHGPIQDALAPLMSPLSVLPLAVVNAFRDAVLLIFMSILNF